MKLLQRFPDPNAKEVVPLRPGRAGAVSESSTHTSLTSQLEINAIVSVRVVQSYIDQTADDSEALLLLLECKAQLQERMDLEGVDCDQLRRGIEREKSVAAACKAAGDTTGAVRALRRAKLMTEEVAEAEPRVA